MDYRLKVPTHPNKRNNVQVKWAINLSYIMFTKIATTIALYIKIGEMFIISCFMVSVTYLLSAHKQLRISSTFSYFICTLSFEGKIFYFFIIPRISLYCLHNGLGHIWYTVIEEKLFIITPSGVIQMRMGSLLSLISCNLSSSYHLKKSFLAIIASGLLIRYRYILHLYLEFIYFYKAAL